MGARVPRAAQVREFVDADWPFIRQALFADPDLESFQWMMFFTLARATRENKAAPRRRLEGM